MAYSGHPSSGLLPVSEVAESAGEGVAFGLVVDFVIGGPLGLLRRFKLDGGGFSKRSTSTRPSMSEGTRRPRAASKVGAMSAIRPPAVCGRPLRPCPPEAVSRQVHGLALPGLSPCFAHGFMVRPHDC